MSGGICAATGRAPAPPAATRLTRLHVTVVSLCLLVTLFDGFDLLAISFAAPAIAREWTLGPDALGAVFSAGIAGMLVGFLTQGPVSDRFGRKPLVVASLALFGGCTLACAFVDTTGPLLALRFVGGIGMGAVMPNALALVAEITPADRRARLIVLLGAGVPAGGLLAGALSAWLLPIHGWRSVFLLGGVAPLMLVPVVATLLPESPLFLLARARKRVGKAAAGDLARVDRLVGRGWARVEPDPPGARQGFGAILGTDLRSGTLLLWLLFAANMTLFYSLLSWLPTMLVTSGVPEHRAALSGVMLNLGGLAGALPLAWAADRVGHRTVLVATFATAAVLLVLLALVIGTSFAAALAMCGLLGVASSGGQLLLNATATALYPTRVRATGIGFAAVAGRAGAMVGPALSGLALGAGLGVPAVLLLLILPAGLAGAGSLLLQADPSSGRPQRPA